MIAKKETALKVMRFLFLKSDSKNNDRKNALNNRVVMLFSSLFKLI